MSLSTQLMRGTLAVPMLLGFALLGFAAGQPAEADAQPVARAADVAQVCLLPATGRALVLAQAPADLGVLAGRWSQPCRA